MKKMCRGFGGMPQMCRMMMRQDFCLPVGFHKNTVR